MNVKPISSEDILEWPDGTWCFRHELPTMSHKSDDYITIPVGTPAWDDVTQERV